MTVAERQRRHRAKLVLSRNAAVASRNEPAPVMKPLPEAVEAPLATVQNAWALAAEAERAEIAAWIRSVTRTRRSPLRKAPPAYTMPEQLRQAIAPIVQALKAQGRRGGMADHAEVKRLADKLEAMLPLHLRLLLESRLYDLRAARDIATAVRAIERELAAVS
ncbi:MAG TPA: hypothetical protein VJ770_23105 [Stellaceae bacterium]|nr:hypothetical protein [Stellaceae bacterium]